MSQSFDAQSARDPRLQQVLDRATTDTHFRQWLLAAPHDAIRDTFGVDIPTSFRIRFVERGADTDALIVLPAATKPAAAPDGELDDAALETVAGGWWDGGTSSTPDNATWSGWQ